MKTVGSFTGILIILALIMTACNSKEALDAEKVRLLETDRQFAKMSVESGAAEAFHHFLADDALQMSHERAPLIGREKIYAGMRPGQENYVLAWEPQRAEVSESMDMGWTWGKYVMSYKDDQGLEQKQYGKYVNIWNRQADGRWKVLVDIGNSSPAPSEASTKN